MMPNHVLIVEDDPLVATYVADVLQDAGFSIAGIASSGAEALAIAAAEPIDIALLDIRLSGPMDGVQLARLLWEGHGIGAIFLSGMNDDASMSRAAAARPLGFLSKPFRPSELYNALSNVLGT